MITKEEAYIIAKEYIERKKRSYTLIVRDKIRLKEEDNIIHGKYYDEKKDVYVVPYEDEGYFHPDLLFIYINAEDGEVLYTIHDKGFVEDREPGGIYYD